MTMPRERKPQVPTGQAYGQKKRLEDAIAAAPPAQSPGMNLAPVPTRQPSIQDAIMSAMVGPAPVPGGLFAPSDRPNEPVTAGAPVGPGPNQVPGLARRNVTTEVLARLAAETGDPLIGNLADRARMMGA